MKLRDRVSILSAEDLPTDDHGNIVFDWDNDNAKVEPAEVVPLSSSENLSAQDTVTTRWRVFLLPFTAADSKSRILWRGLIYEVDGDVELHTDSRARPHHREALLSRVTG